jgi:hypothetical protein
MVPFLRRREPSKPIDSHAKRAEKKKPVSKGQLKPRGNMAKPEVVASPNWGSFRDFWTDCEMTITPYLSGFIDIEGGLVGVSGKWFENCSECSFKISCTACGRNPSNYLQFRAGDGDGIYSVFEIQFEKDSVGALVILDESPSSFTNYLRESIDDTVDKHEEDSQILVDFNRDLYAFFYSSIAEFDRSLELHFAGDINAGIHPVFSSESKSDGLLIFGETGEGKDSDQSLVTIKNILPGTYRSFIFANRDEENNNILVPRILLFLEENAAENIGLTKTFANQINLADEYPRWGEATVFSRIGEPLAPFTIVSNMSWSELQLAIALANENEDLATLRKLQSLSWLLLFQAHNPSSESQEYLLDSMRELGYSTDLIHQLRGQFRRQLISSH